MGYSHQAGRTTEISSPAVVFLYYCINKEPLPSKPRLPQKTLKALL